MGTISAIIWLGGVVGLTGNAALPVETWDQVRTTIERSQECIGARRHRLACARLESLLYPDGITVGVESSTLPPDPRPALGAVLQAERAWRSVLGDDCPIRVVSERRQPAVLIRFTTRLPRHTRDALGIIQLERSYRWNACAHSSQVTGTIDVLLRDSGSELTQDELTHVVMHEFGHLLGLGDVDATGTLMGPLTRGHPVSGPSASEAQAVVELRRHIRRQLADLADRMRSDPGVALIAGPG